MTYFLNSMVCNHGRNIYLFTFCKLNDTVGVQASSFEFRPYVKNIYQCTLTRLKAADIDQEVKERAISCM